MRLAAPPGWEKKKNKREKDPGKNHRANSFATYQEKENLKTEKKQREAERSRSPKKGKKEVWEGRKR